MQFFLILYCLLCIYPPTFKGIFQEAPKMQNNNSCKFSITPQYLSPQIPHPFLSNFESFSSPLFCYTSLNFVFGKSLYEILNLGPIPTDDSTTAPDSSYTPEHNPLERTSIGIVIIIHAENPSKTSYHLSHIIPMQIYNFNIPSNSLVLTSTYDYFTSPITFIMPPKSSFSSKPLQKPKAVNLRQMPLCDIKPHISSFASLLKYKLHQYFPRLFAHLSSTYQLRIRPLPTFSRNAKLPFTSPVNNFYLPPRPQLLQPPSIKNFRNVLHHSTITFNAPNILSARETSTTHNKDCKRSPYTTCNKPMEASLPYTFYSNAPLGIPCIPLTHYAIPVYLNMTFKFLLSKLTYVNNILFPIVFNHSQFITSTVSNKSILAHIGTLYLRNCINQLTKLSLSIVTYISPLIFVCIVRYNTPLYDDHATTTTTTTTSSSYKHTTPAPHGLAGFMLTISFWVLYLSHDKPFSTGIVSNCILLRYTTIHLQSYLQKTSSITSPCMISTAPPQQIILRGHFFAINHNNKLDSDFFFTTTYVYYTFFLTPVCTIPTSPPQHSISYPSQQTMLLCLLSQRVDTVSVGCCRVGRVLPPLTSASTTLDTNLLSGCLYSSLHSIILYCYHATTPLLSQRVDTVPVGCCRVGRVLPLLTSSSATLDTNLLSGCLYFSLHSIISYYFPSTIYESFQPLVVTSLLNTDVVLFLLVINLPHHLLLVDFFTYYPSSTICESPLQPSIVLHFPPLLFSTNDLLNINLLYLLMVAFFTLSVYYHLSSYPYLLAYNDHTSSTLYRTPLRLSTTSNHISYYIRSLFMCNLFSTSYLFAYNTLSTLCRTPLRLSTISHHISYYIRFLTFPLSNTLNITVSYLSRVLFYYLSQRVGAVAIGRCRVHIRLTPSTSSSAAQVTYLLSDFIHFTLKHIFYPYQTMYIHFNPHQNLTYTTPTPADLPPGLGNQIISNHEQ